MVFVTPGLILVSLMVFMKKGVVAGSPQSTLCAVGNWSSCGLGSTSGSSRGPSRVSSPSSTTPMYEKEEDAWELLYAAAGQVVRMKLNDETLKFHGRGVLGPPRKLPSATSLPAKTQSTGFYHNPALTQQQFSINQVEISLSGWKIDHKHPNFIQSDLEDRS